MCRFLRSSWGVRYQAQTKGGIRQLGAQTSSGLLGTHSRKQLSIVEQKTSLLKANADARILSTDLCLASGNPVINEILKSPRIGACERVLGYKYRHYSLVKSRLTLLTLALFTQPQPKHTSRQDSCREGKGHEGRSKVYLVLLLRSASSDLVLSVWLIFNCLCVHSLGVVTALDWWLWVRHSRTFSLCVWSP